MFGICLGHQLLALALGAKTTKMNHGHHGANHPVKDIESGKVEITSMNHGFMVDTATLPDGVRETHRSLFDGSNCGLRMTGAPGVFRSVPSRSQPGAAGQPLPVRAVRRHDGTCARRQRRHRLVLVPVDQFSFGYPGHHSPQFPSDFLDSWLSFSCRIALKDA